jgi:predicted RNase H-like nuclease (RuvC/YqgF family)
VTGENSERSTISSKVEGSQLSCPKIYEEIIQKLEADIRKHIRIEHQLKLHIESTEDRIEELEREQEKRKPFSTDLSEKSNLEKLTKELSKVKTETDQLRKKVK